MNNNSGKGSQRGPVQNGGNRQNDGQPSGQRPNLNRDSEPNRVESWRNQNTDGDQDIHQEKTSEVKNLNQEREPIPMGPGPIQNADNPQKIHHLEPSVEKNRNRDQQSQSTRPGANNPKGNNERFEVNKTQNPEKQKEMRREESTAERNLNRIQDPNSSESWSNSDRERVKATDGTEPGNKTSATQVESSSTSQTQAMYNRRPVSQSSAFQANTQNQKVDSRVSDFIKPKTMGAALYVIAAILLIAWGIGFFFYNAGAAIHVLLVLALISILVKVAQGASE